MGGDAGWGWVQGPQLCARQPEAKRVSSSSPPLTRPRVVPVAPRVAKYQKLATFVPGVYAIDLFEEPPGLSVPSRSWGAAPTRPRRPEGPHRWLDSAVWWGGFFPHTRSPRAGEHEADLCLWPLCTAADFLLEFIRQNNVPYHRRSKSAAKQG